MILRFLHDPKTGSGATLDLGEASASFALEEALGLDEALLAVLCSELCVRT